MVRQARQLPYLNFQIQKPTQPGGAYYAHPLAQPHLKISLITPLPRKIKERGMAWASRAALPLKNGDLFNLKQLYRQRWSRFYKNWLKSSPSHLYLFFLRSKEDKRKNISFFRTKSYSHWLRLVEGKFYKIAGAYIVDAATSSGILKAMQKLGGTFNSDKLGGIAFTKISKLIMCSA